MAIRNDLSFELIQSSLDECGIQSHPIFLSIGFPGATNLTRTRSRQIPG
jgi:hypothetical protein